MKLGGTVENHAYFIRLLMMVDTVVWNKPYLTIRSIQNVLGYFLCITCTYNLLKESNIVLTKFRVTGKLAFEVRGTSFSLTPIYWHFHVAVPSRQ